MEPKNPKVSEEIIAIPKVWEAIPDKKGNKIHHLVTEPVSEYIRLLEGVIETLEHESFKEKETDKSILSRAGM